MPLFGQLLDIIGQRLIPTFGHSEYTVTEAHRLILQINFCFNSKMSPLNNNTLSSSAGGHQTGQHTSSSSHHHQLTEGLMSSSNGQAYSSKPSPGSTSSGNVNVNDSCSSPISSAGSLIPHMTSSVVQAVTAADNWTAALSRSASHHHPMTAATAAFGGHGFAGMYGWY